MISPLSSTLPALRSGSLEITLTLRLHYAYITLKISCFQVILKKREKSYAAFS